MALSCATARSAALRTLALASDRIRLTMGRALRMRCRMTTRIAISRTRHASSPRAAMIDGTASGSHTHRSPRAAHTRSQYSGPAGSSKPAAQRAGRPPSARISRGSARPPASSSRQPATTPAFPCRADSASTLLRGVVPHFGFAGTRPSAARFRLTAEAIRTSPTRRRCPARHRCTWWPARTGHPGGAFRAQASPPAGRRTPPADGRWRWRHR